MLFIIYNIIIIIIIQIFNNVNLTPNLNKSLPILQKIKKFHFRKTFNNNPIKSFNPIKK
jgi:hypothetical protein